MPVRQLTSDLSLYIPNTPILSAAETARLLGFPTREALGKARLAGRLQVRMFKIEGRRGWFASTQQVREWLEMSLSREDSI
jgi:hypothetical protein